MTALLIIYVIWLALMSLVTFFLFIKDKKMAQKNHSEVRIKEKHLLGATALGGAFGAFIGRLVAHHKTDKSYFSLTIYVSMLAEIGVLILLILFQANIL